MLNSGSARMLPDRDRFAASRGFWVVNQPPDRLDSCVSTNEPEGVFLRGSFIDMTACDFRFRFRLAVGFNLRATRRIKQTS
jgi:hypothetical protein